MRDRTGKPGNSCLTWSCKQFDCHYLLYIVRLIYSEGSLYARSRNKIQYCLSVVLWSSDATGVKNKWCRSRLMNTSAEEYLWNSVSVNTDHHGSLPAQQKLHTVLILKMCHILWSSAHLKCTESKWKTPLSSDKSKLQILFGNHVHFKLWGKKGVGASDL